MSEEEESKQPDSPSKESAQAEKKPVPAKAPAKPRPPAKQKLAYEDLIDDPLLALLKEKHGEEILSAQAFLGQPTYTVSSSCLYDVMIDLSDPGGPDFDYLVDLTALDYLPDEGRFCMVYHLYSHRKNSLIRLRTRVAEGEVVPSVTSIWRTADWMEREVFDMFGIEFSGHDDLKRILLPDDWHGHPLRKDYDIKLQDQAWIKKHLQIRKTPV